MSAITRLLTSAVLVTGLLFCPACGGGGGSGGGSGNGGGSGGGGDSDTRAAGPHASELDQVTYWLVTDSSITSEGCSDAASLSDVTAGVEFGDNSFLMYRIDSETQATSQSCTTTSASSCSDGDSVWTIVGHDLTYDAPLVTIGDEASCHHQMATAWALEDKGETATWTINLSFALSADDGTCDDYEQLIIDDSTNGNGMATCVIQTTVEMAFEKSEAP